MTTTTTNNTTTQNDAQTENQYLALILCLATLWLGMWIMSLLRKARIVWLPESGVLLLLGLLLGIFLRLGRGQSSTTNTTMENLTTFNETLFFVLLLPPIVFDAGYTCPRDVFFSNFGMVCGLAFAGTCLTMLFTAVICYGAGNLPGVYQMDFLSNMVFGSIVSATDPVAVLVVFSSLGVDSVLFALVMGESVLNDAVAIVLYQTLSGFESGNDISFATYLIAFMQFCGIFIASTTLGFVLGGLMSIFYKHSPMRTAEAERLECGLVLVIPWLAYFVAQAAYLSGITTILFMAITFAKYGTPNLSPVGQVFITKTYGALAQTSEAFVFLYMGMAFALFNDVSSQHLGFAGMAIVAVVVARFLHVIIIVGIFNRYRHVSSQINIKGTFIVFMAGLRGPLAYALSVAATSGYNPINGQVMQTATVVMIFCTTLIIGILTPGLVKWLGLNKEKSGSCGGWFGDMNNIPLPPAQHQQKQGRMEQLLTKLDTEYFTTWFTCKKVDDTNGLNGEHHHHHNASVVVPMDDEDNNEEDTTTNGHHHIKTNDTRDTENVGDLTII